MAKGYIPVNRDQQFLFPPDMREWLGKDHFVWWLLDVVARLDTKELHKLRRRGAQGRTGYDPDMMLALLLYAYTHKVRSSREIERLCQTDVAFRVICAGNAPDHSTIARFRQDQAALCEKLFAQVLELCALAGLAQVGVVALDGTKVAANASKGANYGRAQLEAQRAKLEAGIQEMFAQAQAADNDEDERFGPKRGDELPAGLAGATARRAALDKALAALAEHEARQRPGKPQVWRARAGRYEQALPAARAAWAAHQATKCPTGRLPRYPQGQQVARIEAKLARAQAKAEAASRAAANRAQVNRTDPDSRLMPIPGGWRRPTTPRPWSTTSASSWPPTCPATPTTWPCSGPWWPPWPRRGRPPGQWGWCWPTPATVRRPTWPPPGPCALSPSKKTAAPEQTGPPPRAPPPKALAAGPLWSTP